MQSIVALALGSVDGLYKANLNRLHVAFELIGPIFPLPSIWTGTGGDPDRH